MDKLYVISFKGGVKEYEGLFNVTREVTMDGDTFITLDNKDEVILYEYSNSNFFCNIVGDSFVFCADTKENCHMLAKRYVMEKIRFINKELERYQEVNKYL